MADVNLAAAVFEPGPAVTPLLELRNLCKRHGERILFDIPHLALQPASAYVLTGMNGAGKSTLLRVLGGLERAETGRLRFAGQEAALHPYPRLLRQAVVYVHQHPAARAHRRTGGAGDGLGRRPPFTRCQSCATVGR
jgi:tungstate transport system ATP-binding protein